MAVTVQLSYVEMATNGQHTLKFTFYNGGPNVYPSWKYDGNYMEIYKNGALYYRHPTIVKFSTSDYLWGSGSPWTFNINVQVDSEDASFYGKTRDIYDEYPQYLAVSDTLRIVGGYSHFYAQSSWSHETVVKAHIRTPRGEMLCCDNPNGSWKYFDFGYQYSYVFREPIVDMDYNSARNVRYSLVNRSNKSFVLGVKTIRLATVYTSQVAPTFNISTVGADVTVSWGNTNEPHYPKGDGVSRKDHIIVRNAADGSVIHDVIKDFRYAGSYKFTTSTDVVVQCSSVTTGLWNQQCQPTVYNQVYYTHGVSTFLGYVKIGGSYRVINQGFVKIGDSYKPITNARVKVANNYKTIK